MRSTCFRHDAKNCLRLSAVLLAVASLASCVPTDDEVGENSDQNIAQASSELELQDPVPVLGRGWDSKEEALRSTCVTGPVGPLPSEQLGAIKADRSISSELASSLLGFELEAKARYKIVKASAKAEWVKTTTETKTSQTFVFAQEVKLPSRGLDLTGTDLSSQGTAAAYPTSTFTSPLYPSLYPYYSPNKYGFVQQGDPWSFYGGCGDTFVSQLHYGGQLFFSFRLDFASSAVKEAFQAELNVSVNGGVASGDLKARMQSASAKFGSSVQVSVAALQLGGKPEYLAQSIGGTIEGDLVVADCTMGDLAQCNTMLGQFVDYAKLTFPGQVTNGGGAVVGYSVESYQNLPNVMNKVGTLSLQTQAVMDDRASLREVFEKARSNARRIEVVLSGAFGTSPEEENLRSWAFRIRSEYFPKIDSAVAACFDNLVFDRATKNVTSTSASACRDAVLPLLSLQYPPETYFLVGAHRALYDKAQAIWGNTEKAAVSLKMRPYDGRAEGLCVEYPSDLLCAFKRMGDVNYRTHYVSGVIFSKYRVSNVDRQDLEGAVSYLGYPASDKLYLSDGRGFYNRFEDGGIYVNPGTYRAFVLSKEIESKWIDEGWQAGWGYPVGDTYYVTHNNYYRAGRRADFQKGSIIAKLGVTIGGVQGDIRNHYNSMGAQDSSIGYPNGNEYTESYKNFWGQVYRYQRQDFEWNSLCSRWGSSYVFKISKGSTCDD